MAIIEATSWDKLFEVFKEGEYLKTVVQDEENFIDLSKSQVFPSMLVGILDEPS